MPPAVTKINPKLHELHLIPRSTYENGFYTPYWLLEDRSGRKVAIIYDWDVMKFIETLLEVAREPGPNRRSIESTSVPSLPLELRPVQGNPRPNRRRLRGG